MTTVALTVLTGGMTTLATDFILMDGVSNLIALILMAGLAFRTVFDFIFRFIQCAVTVHFLFFVAIITHHALLIMDVGCSSVFSGKFRIDTASVTGSAGFAFIFLDKFVTLQKAGGNAADRRRFNMTASAGGVARTAGFFKHFIIEGFQFCGGESVFDTFSLSEARVMKRLGVILTCLDVAYAAVIKLIGWSGNASFVSGFFGFALLIALMTGDAVHRKMKLIADHFLVDQITLVIFFRPDRGRSARSPLGLAAYFRRLD
jgi:hypothetical protein